jgi:hypothetical protein
MVARPGRRSAGSALTRFRVQCPFFADRTQDRDGMGAHDGGRALRPKPAEADSTRRSQDLHFQMLAALRPRMKGLSSAVK